MTNGERHLCDFQFGNIGSFYGALMKAFFRADNVNFYKLSQGFPEEAEAVRRYRNEENYWDELRKEYIGR